jgi:outer membrane protein OmpA-like peptidoglycan-associated protein
MRRNFIILGLIVVLMVSLIGCSNWSRRDKGALIGAGAGAVIGGVIGDKAGNTAAGAILGAVVGGAAGAYIGNYMDKQAEEIEKDIEGAKVERIGEGIKITFDSGILFDVNKSDLKPAAKANLEKLAVILNKYSDTQVLVEGHTDSTGPTDYNLELSEKRAKSVSRQLAIQNVMETRLIIMGYGEEQPIASNDTADGRQQNRRVDIAIYANDKLKGIAKKQVEEG